MIQGFPAFEGSLNEDGHILFDLFLTNIFLEPARPETLLPAILNLLTAGNDALIFFHSLSPPCHDLEGLFEQVLR